MYFRMSTDTDDGLLKALLVDGPKRININVCPMPEPDVGRNMMIRTKTRTIKSTLLLRGSPPASLKGAIFLIFSFIPPRYVAVFSLCSRDIFHSSSTFHQPGVSRCRAWPANPRNKTEVQFDIMG